MSDHRAIIRLNLTRLCDLTTCSRRLEVPREDFKIEMHNVIGEGEFTDTFRAVLRDQHVAVKLSRPQTPPSRVKEMLTELKLLARLGCHCNIVGLIGANMKYVANGQVYIFREFCLKGNLRAHLVSNRGPSGTGPSNTSCRDNANIPGAGISVPELLVWCIQIANGMMYLARKNIILIDLAARKILLTDTLIAKISDFDLAVEPCDDESYYMKAQKPLPWRQMAPESLDKLEFSSKSDVWSFGITMWEILSFGEVPYAGVSWNSNFVQDLSHGKAKLDQPRYASSELYNLMLKCWSVDTKCRPTFKELHEQLHKILYY